MRKTVAAVLGVVAVATVVTAAYASVTFNSADGTGFVGKGDVQLALGLNNKQMQATAVSFAYESTEVTEVSWVCTNSNNEQTQERERTTTSTVQGVLASIARERNQITGYILTGYDGAANIQAGAVEGPAVNSCPNNSSTWHLTTPAGAPEVVSSTGGLTVNGVAIQ